MCVCLAPLEDLTRALHFPFPEVPLPFWFGLCCLLAMAFMPWIPSFWSGTGMSSSKCYGPYQAAPGLCDCSSQIILWWACSPLWAQASPDFRCLGHAHRLPEFPSHPEEVSHELLFLFLFFLNCCFEPLSKISVMARPSPLGDRMSNRVILL